MNQQWLAERKKCIGASEAAAIMGESKWATPFSVWAAKVHDIDVIEETERMRIGKALEPVIADLFSDWAEQNIGEYCYLEGDGETLFTSVHHPFIACSPDKIVCKRNGDVIGILEIKTTDGRNLADWIDAPPLYYQIQVQQQLYVMNMTRAWIAVLIGGNEFRVYPCKRNDVFIKALVNEEVRFWNDHVLTKIAPPTDGHPATTTALKLLHPQDSGAEIELPEDEWKSKLDRLARIKKAQKRLNENQAVLENELKSVIQDATYAHIGASTVSWKTQTRAEYQVAESTSRVLRIGKRK